MGKYTKVIQDNYQEQPEINKEYKSKYEYLGAVIFDFTTYDSEMDTLLASRMIPVLRALVEEQTFEYIKDRDRYENYIAMVNTPFLVDKIDWGTSIGGAWLDNSNEYEIDCGRINIPKGGLTEFITDLLEWCKS